MTEQADLNVTAMCQDCRIGVVTDDKNDDESVVYCPQCKREFGSWGSVKAKMQKAGVDHLRGELKKAVKGLKGWKVR
ncbi:hypothetical protein G6M50_38175 [Agrobacterium rhizogenes]|nr:hypothetical protein [Rhizobium rhizogenes]NTJ83616.1 hypothetical protein [Rhizobium rhizogenes]